MKKTTALLVFLVMTLIGNGQDCTSIHVDLLKGTINGLLPSASQEEVKKKLPCFGASTPDGSKENCGGGVFFAKQGFFFYTGKDNINIRKGFAGTISIDLMGKTEADAIVLLGKPEGDITDDDGARFVFFKRSWGCIVIGFDDDKKVDEIFIYATPPEQVDLCV
jgi:hypothetical protein